MEFWHGTVCSLGILVPACYGWYQKNNNKKKKQAQQPAASGGILTLPDMKLYLVMVDGCSII